MWIRLSGKAEVQIQFHKVLCPERSLESIAGVRSQLSRNMVYLHLGQAAVSNLSEGIYLQSMLQVNNGMHTVKRNFQILLVWLMVNVIFKSILADSCFSVFTELNGG